MYAHPYLLIRALCSGPAKKDGNSSGLEVRFSTLGVKAARRTAPEVEYNLIQNRQQGVSVTLVTHTTVFVKRYLPDRVVPRFLFLLVPSRFILLWSLRLGAGLLPAHRAMGVPNRRDVWSGGRSIAAG